MRSLNSRITRLEHLVADQDAPEFEVFHGPGGDVSPPEATWCCVVQGAAPDEQIAIGWRAGVINFVASVRGAMV